MARSRDISKVLSSSTALATDAEISATYQTKAAAGLTLITPTTIANTSGTASIGTNGTVSFSAASSVSLNDVFTSTYDHYKILIDLTGISTDSTIGLRLRVNNADDTSTSYINMGTSISQTGVTSAYSTTTGTYYEILNTDGAYTGHYYSASVELYKPAVAIPTTCHRNSQGVKSDSTTFQSHIGNLLHSLSTAYSSCTLMLSTGTFTGTISVYGYNK